MNCKSTVCTSALCVVHVPNCVYVFAWVFKIVLHGQKQWDADWFVKTDFVCICMHVLASVYVCV